MGCPVRKVVKTGGGSALMCDSGAASSLVGAVVRAAGVPVTVKMRLGWDDETLSAPGLAREFEQEGAAAVIIHGRTRAQGFKGGVNRDGIRAVVEAVDRMPVVGNGDVRTIADAEGMLRGTGCAAVSIGRGSLANPFLFRQLAHWAEHGTPGPDPTFEERVGVMERHFHRLVERRGEHHACLQFRKLVKWYSHSIPASEGALPSAHQPRERGDIRRDGGGDPGDGAGVADPGAFRAESAGAVGADRQVVRGGGRL